MSQSKVIASIVKTDNFFKTDDGKDMYQYDFTFESDATTYSAYSPSPAYLEKFQKGTSVTVTANPSKKMPNKIKIEAAGGATQSAPAAAGKSSGFKRSPDTNRSIMAQTSLKAATDFFKDRPNSSLEDVANGMVYLLSKLEETLNGAQVQQTATKPSIPTDFLDRLPN